MAELENTTETVTGENTEVTNEAEVKTEAKEEEKVFTQADVDALIEKRLLREKKKAEKEAAAAQEAEKAKDDSDEIRQLKDMMKAKDQRIIKQEAVKAATTMGIDVDFIDAATALADFSKIELDNNGEVDVEELKEALKSVIDRYPKFVATKTEEKQDTGFVKAGVPNKQTTKTDEDALRKAFGLK